MGSCCARESTNWGAMDPRSPLVKGSDARSDAALLLENQSLQDSLKPFTDMEKLLYLRLIFAESGMVNDDIEEIKTEIEREAPDLLRRLTYEY